jgi:cell division protein FtsW (lipid II flippase)
MQGLTKKAFTGLIWLQISMALMLFLPAWTVRFWKAWIYWLLFSVLSLVVTLHFLKHDPRLLKHGTKEGQGSPSHAPTMLAPNFIR